MRDVPYERMEREGPSCDGCGSSVRMRSVVFQLIRRFYAEPAPLPDLVARKEIVGFGLSDWEGYSQQLERLFTYTNTFYHAEPRIDIMQVPDAYLNRADFLISSDVFEHCPPPVGIAFHGARHIRKPGGWLVMTVPHRAEGDGHENFPDLLHYQLVELGGEWVLVNRAADGSVSVREGLVFHGGPGAVLEMRIFARHEVERYLAESGFADVTVHEEEVPEWGILLHHREGVTITARRVG
jgi:hypothetical protein